VPSCQVRERKAQRQPTTTDSNSSSRERERQAKLSLFALLCPALLHHASPSSASFLAGHIYPLFNNFTFAFRLLRGITYCCFGAVLLEDTATMDFSSEPGPKMGACIRGRATSSSASYHESGSHLYVASEADSVLRIVDCLNGGAPQMIKLQREGIRTVKATHHAQCVLFSPGLKNGPKKNNVYYLSVHDNKILREFEGHQSVVTSISMSPVDDSFLSSSADGTVRYVVDYYFAP